MRRSTFILTAAMLVAAAPAIAQIDVAAPSELKKYNVTVRRFDPAQGLASGTDFVLPVDSPDEEHAAASTLSNAISFSRKVEGGKALPVAFTVIRITPR